MAIIVNRTTKPTKAVEYARSDPSIIRDLILQCVPPAIAPMFVRPFEPFPEPFVGMGVRVVIPEDVPLEEVLPPATSPSPSRGWSAESRKPIQAQTYLRRSWQSCPCTFDLATTSYSRISKSVAQGDITHSNVEVRPSWDNNPRRDILRVPD